MRSKLVFLLVVGTGIPALIANAAPAALGGSNAVLAVIDTGINPYHTTFRDTSPRAFEHPSTYLPGYPADAIALYLTFDAVDYQAAVVADCENVWRTVESGKLYWFPGTRIVGAISFVPQEPVTCEEWGPYGQVVLDGWGHGTMTASRAASKDYGACKTCLIVSVQFSGFVSQTNPEPSTEEMVRPIEWAAANSSWIDAQSNSWGPGFTGWDPTGKAGMYFANPRLVRAVEQVSSTHLAFWASGNGTARSGGLGQPSMLSPHLGPSAIIVGGHDSGYVNLWPGFPPHVVSDSCDSWAANANSIDGSGDDVGGGTSASTPFVAGGAVRILRDAREILGDAGVGVRDGIVAQGPSGLVPAGPLADGEFTLDEWKRVLLETATPRPLRQFEDGPPCDHNSESAFSWPWWWATPVQWKDVPAEYPEYLNIGYGAVDGPSVDLAMKVLRGQVPPDRSRTDAFFDLDREARSALHGVFRG